ncbi:hypothetical protein [Rhodopirellula sp. MGV]|uniref:hypothetical protein n=1 Tax=Rhodopirellula sp. MGV TaxID=2023130 RepID=UPI000B96651D|nr:hypothetical protein [Rhodopirellula sp. MGV]PNY34926.1 hypothetical protein C2E31_20690 [Rhodopirellula baltica]
MTTLPAPDATEPWPNTLDQLRLHDKQYTNTDQVASLLAPNGIGKSKLAANMEQNRGVTNAARNYRTVDKVPSMTK